MSIRYHLPPEWAPQSGVMLTWPRSDGDWSPDYASVERCHTQLAKEISLREHVVIVCMDALHADKIRRLVKNAGGRVERLHLFALPSNDAWARDHGPITVLKDGRPTLLDFIFNGWGNKYPHGFDDEITRKLHGLGAFGAVPLESFQLVLEGGSIDVDGEGTLLTTESCLLNPNRNPTINRREIEDALKEWLGVTSVLFLGDGIAGDDTDGHVDDLARFVAPGTVVTVVENDPGDANYRALEDNLTRLEAMRDAAGRRLRIERLPMPPALFHEGIRVPASYANFYILNDGVIVPTFDCAA